MESAHEVYEATIRFDSTGSASAQVGHKTQFRHGAEYEKNRQRWACLHSNSQSLLLLCLDNFSMRRTTPRGSPAWRGYDLQQSLRLWRRKPVLSLVRPPGRDDFACSTVLPVFLRRGAGQRPEIWMPCSLCAYAAGEKGTVLWEDMLWTVVRKHRHFESTQPGGSALSELW